MQLSNGGFFIYYYKEHNKIIDCPELEQFIIDALEVTATFTRNKWKILCIDTMFPGYTFDIIRKTLAQEFNLIMVDSNGKKLNF